MTHSPEQRKAIGVEQQLRNLLGRLKVDERIVWTIYDRFYYVYKKLTKESVLHGRPLASVIPAILYIAFRELEIPITLKEIAVASYSDLKAISKNYRLFSNVLGERVAIKPANPVKRIVIIARKSEVSEITKRKAIRIFRLASSSEEELARGRDPMALAVSSLYVAAQSEKESLSPKVLAELSGVHESTIYSQSKMIRNHKSISKNLGLESFIKTNDPS